MRVEIDTENSAQPELLIRLEQKKPLLERWARRWRTNLVAVATTAQGIYLEPSPGTVIFKPYSSTPLTLSSPKELTTVFGYALPDIANERTRLSPSTNALQFLSPEKNRIAQAQQGTFSFLVNVLGYDWEGAEEVVNIMFACTLPKALPKEYVKKRASRLKEVLRRKLKRDRTKIEEAYPILIEGRVRSSIGRHEREIREITARMAEKEVERLALLSEIAEIEDFLAHTEAHAKTAAEIGRMFEQLLRMEGAAIIRIELEHFGSVTVPIITIYTKRILKEDAGKICDIGSFLIKIDPSTGKLGRESIRFVQDSRGEYIHPNALPNFQGQMDSYHVCFGNDLNEPINKLVADFDFVPLVHLLLTFLRLDSKVPIDAPGKRTEDVAKHLSYASPEDHAKEREAFVAVVVNVMQHVAAKKSRMQLSVLGPKEATVAKDYYALRRDRNELKKRVELLRQRLTALPRLIGNVIRRLLLNPDVLYVRVLEKSLQVWFWNAKTSSIHMIWLDPQRSPWIVGYEKIDGVSTHHSFEAGDLKFNRRILKHLASGKLAQAAGLIISHILKFSATGGG
ncbi:MAG: hypothetical protein Q8Q41_00845 [bacterium]|nr:hypothetical protein [bacterium]